MLYLLVSCAINLTVRPTTLGVKFSANLVERQKHREHIALDGLEIKFEAQTFNFTSAILRSAYVTNEDIKQKRKENLCHTCHTHT